MPARAQVAIMLFQDSARFLDRDDAGSRLARRLRRYAARPGLIVLGLPRGGVPVARRVAQALGADLDVLLVRKLGVPGHEELAMGAVAHGGIRVLNDDVVEQLGIADSVIDAATERELREIERQARLYRGKTEPPDVRGRTVILVDDGLATGATARAGLQALRLQDPAELVLAAPVGSPQAIAMLRAFADDVVVELMPEPLLAVGVWYRQFGQTSDEEVTSALAAPALPPTREDRHVL
jgi:predicted phosphoribosyltransferase